MATPFIAQISMFGSTFAPRGWAFCNGQLLPISQNTALFSLVGTTYGGDGRSTFGLPNLQGRSPIHWGSGPGLSTVTIGESAGSETVTILTSNLPPHTHTVAVSASSEAGTSAGPIAGGALARGSETEPGFTSAAGNVALAATTSSVVGSGAPISIRSPYLAVSFIIALQGVFPSRN